MSKRPKVNPVGNLGQDLLPSGRWGHVWARHTRSPPSLQQKEETLTLRFKVLVDNWPLTQRALRRRTLRLLGKRKSSLTARGHTKTESLSREICKRIVGNKWDEAQCLPQWDPLLPRESEISRNEANAETILE